MIAESNSLFLNAKQATVLTNNDKAPHNTAVSLKDYLISTAYCKTAVTLTVVLH